MSSPSRSSSCCRSDSSCTSKSRCSSSSASPRCSKHLHQVKRKFKGHCSSLRHSCWCRRRHGENAKSFKSRRHGRSSNHLHLHREDSCKGCSERRRKCRRERKHYKKQKLRDAKQRSVDLDKFKERSVDQNCTGPHSLDSSENLAHGGQSLAKDDTSLDAKIGEERKREVSTTGIIGTEFERNKPVDSRDETDCLMWTLYCVKASKPSVVDLTQDDFKLSLPEHMPLEIAKVSQEIDLNVAVEKEESSKRQSNHPLQDIDLNVRVEEELTSMEQSMPLRLPAAVSCVAPILLPQQNSLMKWLPPQVVNDTFDSQEFKDTDRIKQCSKACADVTASCQVITLDSSEDDQVQMEGKRSGLFACSKGDQGSGLKKDGRDFHIKDKGTGMSKQNCVHGADFELKLTINGFKARKKRGIHRTYLSLQESQ